MKNPLTAKRPKTFTLQKPDDRPAAVIKDPPIITIDCDYRILTMSSGGVVLANAYLTDEPIVFEDSDGFRVEVKVTLGRTDKKQKA